MSAAPKLSDGIGFVLGIFEEHGDIAEGQIVEIDAEGVRLLIESLSMMRKYAINLEIELACLRDMEAGREIRSFLDSEATAHLSDMMQETESKVVRPNFGRKRP